MNKLKSISVFHDHDFNLNIYQFFGIVLQLSFQSKILGMLKVEFRSISIVEVVDSTKRTASARTTIKVTTTAVHTPRWYGFNIFSIRPSELDLFFAIASKFERGAKEYSTVHCFIATVSHPAPAHSVLMLRRLSISLVVSRKRNNLLRCLQPDDPMSLMVVII